MAYTTTHLAAIEAAIATGELTVTVDGRRIAKTGSDHDLTTIWRCGIC